MSYGEPLSVIGGADAEQRFERVVRREREAGGVDEELAGNIEEDEEEVERAETENDVCLRDVGLLFEVAQGRVSGQLCFPSARAARWCAPIGVQSRTLIELGEVVLGPGMDGQRYRDA